MSGPVQLPYPDLWLAHWPHRPARIPWPAPDRAALLAQGPLLETCLRRMSFGLGPRPVLPAGGELLAGIGAYRFALEVATGLRSEVPGETNVFGQLRQAIAAFQAGGDPAAIRRLRPVLEQLLRDTRAIRQACLQGIGGTSWGSLVRRLLAAQSGERILFVGAGALTRSMLGLFRDYETGLWTRRALPAPPGAGRLFAPAEAATAAAWAEHVIMATPADPLHDALWCARLRHGGARTLVHLGHHRLPAEAWPERLRIITLEQLFALARAQAGRRSAQLHRAHQACADRAQRLAGGGTEAVPPLLASA